MNKVKLILKKVYNRTPWQMKKENKVLMELLAVAKKAHLKEMEELKTLKDIRKSETFIRCYKGFADTNNRINKILLNNSSEIELSKIEREECLNYYKMLSGKKSENAEVKIVAPIPIDWPKDLVLAPLPESTNDFNWKSVNKKDHKAITNSPQGLSIVIPTFNRSKILEITLACLVNQKTDYKFEVIVSDDGSQEDLSLVIEKFHTRLDIRLVKQSDQGYRLCAVRNLGLRAAKYEFVAILDCDMAPNNFWVQSYMELLSKDDDVALMGPRKYVDTHHIDPREILRQTDLVSSLPEVVTHNNVAGKVEDKISVDWRLEHFKNSDNLRLCNTPFRYFSGGNVAFAKKWLDIVGWFDEEFTHWGGEDNEFGYRLYREGCFFRAVDGGMAYHQEPPGKENETDRAAGKAVTIKIVEQKVPYFYRKLQKIESAVIKKVPLVSIYIPAYNCENSIERCIESALGQTVTDLEVCVCDDGSTDGTLELLKNKYAKNPRVRYMTQKNGGIGKASNSAVKMTRGYYIAQLDSDDYLEPDAVELCLKEFMNDNTLACVYTTNRNVNPDGSLISNGYNWPFYSREKLTSVMICHHFRMFTARAWNLTAGFDEEITNAVDYDMYLKLSEVGPFKHINKICYNRVLHGENTSIKNLSAQSINHFIVVNNSLRRQQIDKWKYVAQNDDPSCRKYIFMHRENKPWI
ncbi:MAG: glycosyltransferase [Campylobacterota bacterium]|nr:glycosyltransferase [Campylobacterota bacterium]